MQNSKNSAQSRYAILDQIFALFEGNKQSESVGKTFLYILGIIGSPLSLYGALLGFKRSYIRFGLPNGERPTLNKMKPITWIAMFLGTVVTWWLTWVVVQVVSEMAETLMGGDFSIHIAVLIAVVNVALSAFLLRYFKRWQQAMSARIDEQDRYGSASFASKEDLQDLERKQGFYVGAGKYGYPKQGHKLTIGGARGGKGVNVIIPNLLGVSGYEGSWFILDVKAELCAITQRKMRESGQQVYILDPFGIGDQIADTYNPLDLVTDQTNPDDLIDDVDLLSEMIVPKGSKGDVFWDNRARGLISGMLLHLITTVEKENRTLTKLWEWLRLPIEQFEELLADMMVNDSAIVRATATEYANVIHTAEKMFQSVMSVAQEKTDFLKSPALQKSMASSSFNIGDITNGKTTLYVLFPPSRLDTHYQWLRLVMTTALRSAVRNHDKHITFLLDEFAALGYIPEMRTAFSTYAGYNISMWPIVQDLGQLQNLYNQSWETFISNSVVRQFLSVSDVFSLEYLSKLVGTTTAVTYDSSNGGKAHATSRPLATPDEVRRLSANNMLVLVEQKPIAVMPKLPYYEMQTLNGAYDPNPYYKP